MLLNYHALLMILLLLLKFMKIHENPIHENPKDLCFFFFFPIIHDIIHFKFKEGHFRDFPGGPVVRILPSNAGGAGSVPSQGAKILWPKPKNRK